MTLPSKDGQQTRRAPHLPLSRRSGKAQTTGKSSPTVRLSGRPSAEAAKNPLFPLLLRSLAGFVKYVARESCRGDLVRLRRAVQSHESITEAIHWKDPERARVEMEAHLHCSANRILTTWTNDSDSDAISS
jgi:hypothetical protein